MFSQNANACTCGWDFQRNVKNADLIFIGVPQGEQFLDEDLDVFVVEFEVFRWYKGRVTETVKISTPSDSCGVRFEPYKLQAVVAHGTNGLYGMDHCNEGFSVMDYVNYFERPSSRFEPVAEWQSCFFKLKDMYEKKPSGESVVIDDPVCEKYQVFYDRYFHHPTKADFGLKRGRAIP